MLPEYVSAKYLQPLISEQVRSKILDSITYISLNGTRSNAIRATVLADICDIWIKAKQNGAIEKEQFPIADNAYTLRYFSGNFFAHTMVVGGFEFGAVKNIRAGLAAKLAWPKVHGVVVLEVFDFRFHKSLSQTPATNNPPMSRMRRRGERSIMVLPLFNPRERK